MPSGLGGASRIGIVVFCRRSRRVVLGSWWGVKLFGLGGGGNIGTHL